MSDAKKSNDVELRDEIPNGVDVILPNWYWDVQVHEFPELNEDDLKRMRELTRMRELIRMAIAADRIANAERSEHSEA